MIMASFSLGAAAPIMALAYGSRRAIIARRDWFGAHIADRQARHGATLIGVGGFVFTGFDKVVEAALTRAMPDWLVTVTTRL